MSEKVQDIILNCIIEMKGNATKNDVVRHMEEYHDPLLRLSRVKTLQVIEDFERFHKINLSKGGRRGQAHYLSVNDKDEFNLIKNELSDIEPFIKRTNQYFSRRVKENLEDIGLSNSDDEDKRSKYDKRTHFTLEQERHYKLTAHRMLDDFYHITATSNLSRQDSERFIKKIIELKTMLAYHEWSIDVEKSFFKLQIANLRTYERHIKQAGLEDYFQERQLKGKLIDPLKARIEKFQQFLANQI